MEPELELRLQLVAREQLVLLVRELAARHPVLLAEIVELLEQYTEVTTAKDQTDEEITEDWDFSGDELITVHTPPQPALTVFDSDIYRQRIHDTMLRLDQGNSAQSVQDEISLLLDEAQQRGDQHDYQHAIELYALVIDERLSETRDALALLFDKAIDAHLIELEGLLTEASSNILFDAQSSFSPLLTPALRQQWLTRLFTLWLKRMDARRLEEHVPEIILNVAWSDDLNLLHQLVQEELQRRPVSTHSNIVDFRHEYRTRTLEKFLKELPRP